MSGNYLNCVSMTFRSLVVNYLILKVTFPPLYLFSKKICFKFKPQFLTKNLRDHFVLNGLCMVWPILVTKNILLLTFIVSKCLWATVSKDDFPGTMSTTKIRKYSFSAYHVCITKVNEWVKLGLQRVKI